jgi:hypothetical protein
MSGLNLISRSFQCEFNWLLNPFTVFDSITFAGKLFQVSTTLCEKLYFLILVLHWFLYILCLWPLVVFSFFGKILLLFILSNIYIVNDSKRFYLVRDSSVVRRHYISLLEPSNVRVQYIRKTADLLHQLWVGTFPRFVAIGFYFLSETLI